MRTARTAVAVTAVAAGLLALSACGGGAAPAASGPSASGGERAAVKGSSASPAEAVPIGRCHTAGLGYSWAGGAAAPDPGSPRQQEAEVVLRNAGARPCTLHGFPRADLVGGGRRWSLLRDTLSPGTVTLGPGGTARFTVTFLPWTPDGAVERNDFAPTALVITPPGGTASYDLPWHWGHVLLQDGAGHPGTYVGPVGG